MKGLKIKTITAKLYLTYDAEKKKTNAGPSKQTMYFEPAADLNKVGPLFLCCNKVGPTFLTNPMPTSNVPS